MKTPLGNIVAKFALALVLLTPALLQAGVFNFSVDIDTTVLNSAADGPFFLDFQLNSGQGTQTNTAVLNGFQFNGGSVTGSPTLFGGATGGLAGTVTLNDASNPFTELFQGFTSGTTGIHFNASLSQNGPGSQPDGFSVSILDSTLGQIYTTDPNQNLSLLSLGITSANSLADVHTYSSTAPSGVTVAVTAIPEPAYTVALFGGLATAFAGIRRFRRQQIA